MNYNKHLVWKIVHNYIHQTNIGKYKLIRYLSQFNIE